MSFVNSLIDAVNQCPEYIGKGIMELLILTIGGILVAWITTLVFGRKSEINAVEGVLLKRKMDIYEELDGKLEDLKAAVMIPTDFHEAALRSLKEEKLSFNPINSNQILKIFDSPKQLTDAFLELDKYIASKRLYFDNEVMIQTMRFQNYFALFRRLVVMFEEQFIDNGIPLDKPEVVAAERLLTVELGILLQEELVKQMDNVIATMKQSFINLSFKHREQIEYTYEYYNSPDGPIMSELKNTIIMTQREKIMALVTKAAAIGMAGSVLSGKKKQ